MLKMAPAWTADAATTRAAVETNHVDTFLHVHALQFACQFVRVLMLLLLPFIAKVTLALHFGVKLVPFLG